MTTELDFCCIHLVSNENDDLQEISAKSRKKIIACKMQWVSLDGDEKRIAQKLDELKEFQNDITEDNEVDTSYRYHRKCYMRFTDITKIDRAKKRKEKEPSNDSPSQKYSRPVRTTNTSSVGIFPFICIICEKEQYDCEKHSRKRRKQKLVVCQTHDASDLLLQAATAKNDHVLNKIRDIDCIAKEVKYHKNCYRSYTKHNSSSSNAITTQYKGSYQHFCKIYIEGKIINNGEVISMNKLTLALMKITNTDENEPETVSNRQLKRWLHQDYPTLIFVKPKHRTLSELVINNAESCKPVIITHEEASTSTDASEADCTNMKDPKQLYDHEAKSNIYKSAIFMRNVINESPFQNYSWPPTADDLNEAAAFKMVPVLLYNFLTWCVGENDIFDSENIVSTSVQSQKKILSIAQDIIYLASKGRKQTPKHLSLAMAIRHITGSSKILEVVHGLGHCISHSATLQYDTALAEFHLQSCDSLPMDIKKEVFTTVVWDNIDFPEETLTGHNTTHNTNGIIVQRATNEPTEAARKSIKKVKKRTVNPPVTHISQYFPGKKFGPQSIFEVTNCETRELIAGSGAKEIDCAYILCKLPEFSSKILPGWTGFNIKIQATNILPVSTIRYLPVVEANPTQISTVYTLLLKSIEIADRLELEQLVLVFDQAIYAKAQQIRWKDTLFQHRLVIRLGEFHIILAFLGIVGKRYKDAGLGNIIIESGITAEGSINGVMTGKFYNRSIRVHKIVYEALYRLLWTAFLNTISEGEFLQIQDVVSEVQKSYEYEYLDESILPLSFNAIVQNFNKFVDEHCEENATFRFWVSYLNMIECLQQFIRATRVGNWMLHLASITQMIPWFFAYDRINYARYLPVYVLEMLNLEKTHSFIHSKMLNGEFVVNRENKYGFCGTAFDQVIEQTANKDSKTKGGLVGLTQNSNATHRWLLSHHLRAQIATNCYKLAGKNCKQRSKIHLDDARIKKDEANVCNVVSTVNSMINPFTWEENNLVNISSGFIASTQIQKDLETAYSIGAIAYDQFKETRLLDETSKMDIFSPLKLQKLNTFTDLSSSASIEKHKPDSIAVSTNKLLAKIIVNRESKNLDMQEIMGYSLNAHPPSISNPDGTLVKTNKAALVHHLLDLVKPKEISLNCIPKDNKVLIIDGMMLIWQMKSIPETFGALAEQLLQNIMQKAMYYGAQRVDFVTDRYPYASIKNNERQRRANNNSTTIKIVSRNQKTPNLFKNFISNGQNKTALIEFLYEEWTTLESSFLENINLVIAHGNMCHSVVVTKENLCINELPELYCDHEEADTRMMLHIGHASKDIKKNIIICSSDTDVFILSLSVCLTINARIFLINSKSSDHRFVEISDIGKTLGSDMCIALVGLHIFTGCDSTSAFKGKGKVKAFNIMQKNSEYIHVFKQLGETWNIDIASLLVNVLEMFVCELYGYTKYKTVNKARFMLFKLKLKMDTFLPPNFDSLMCHVKRTNYQAAIYRRCLCPVINAPCPSGSGWCFQEKDLQIQWNSIPHTPEILLQQVSCRCSKTNCTTKQCSCKAKNMFCTDICSCVGCININETVESFDESGTDSDID